MSFGLIVHVQELENSRPRLFLEYPPSLPDAYKGFELPAAPAGLMGALESAALPPGHLRTVGEFLFNCLEVHPAIKKALPGLMMTLDGQRQPLYFYLDPPEVDEWPWECLHDPQHRAGRFLALDKRWPIARLRHPASEVKTEYAFTTPLRVLAVLSATGADALTQIPSRPEWQSLHDVLAAARLPFKLKALVSEPDLKAAIDGSGDAKLSAETISDKDTLLGEIARFRPHLLHFFSHGSADDPPHLSIGTVADWVGEKPGSIILEAVELWQRGDPQLDVWLVVLNCCETAANARESRSLASSLASAGFPAVIGMRERVASADAHVFCERLYEAVLEWVAGPTPGGPPVEIMWASAVWKARQALITASNPGVPLSTVAPDYKPWTVPVLYTRRDPFRLRRLPDAPALSLSETTRLLAERDEISVARQRIEARNDLPPAVRNGILSEFKAKLAEIDAQLS